VASRRKTRVSPHPGNIPAALAELGLKIAVRDDEVITLCPYHDDHRAGSFSVRISDGENYCFSCGQGGSFAYLVRMVLKVDPFTAGRWCRDRAYDTDITFEYEELEYGSGKIDTSEQVNEASLALCTAPPQDALDSRQISAETAAAYGVLWDQGKWIIPVRDPLSGSLWGWQEKQGRFFRNYPDGLAKSQSLFGYNLLEDGGTAVLVESPLDCLRLAAAGCPGAVSGYGVGVSREQLDLILNKASHLVLALDNDIAGMAKTVDICRNFRRMPVTVFNYGETTAKDPGEMDDSEILWGFRNELLWTEIQEMIC
jgi:Toprim-like/CHC2 zinc finger